MAFAVRTTNFVSQNFIYTLLKSPVFLAQTGREPYSFVVARLDVFFAKITLFQELKRVKKFPF
jgi:hypothetical protein